MPKAKVIRENYHVVRPPLSNFEALGKRIYTKCSTYDTFWLEKFVRGGELKNCFRF